VSIFFYRTDFYENLCPRRHESVMTRMVDHLAPGLTLNSPPLTCLIPKRFAQEGAGVHTSTGSQSMKRKRTQEKHITGRSIPGSARCTPRALVWFLVRSRAGRAGTRARAAASVRGSLLFFSTCARNHVHMLLSAT
jgi:hypothetical protein